MIEPRPFRVGYSGIEGSFAYKAARKLFPEAEYISFAGFRECYEATERKECDRAVLPIENSFAGEVGEVTDLIYRGTLTVTGQREFPIEHCLLGVPESTEDSIETVLSHPQAIAQCAGYINEHGLRATTCQNTARAARAVAEGHDKKVGAIASADNAALYGLKILKRSIQDSNHNATKFLTLTKDPLKEKEVEETDISILMFTTENVAGSLLRALSVIAGHGYNMRVIRSRPVKDVNWEYYFYTEIEGNLYSDKGRKMISELEKECRFLKIAGTFGAGEKELE